MPRFDEESTDWSDDDDSWNDAYDDDSFADEEEPTIACPYCDAEIHEDSQRCPACGEYISTEDAPYRQKPGWIVLGVAVCLLLVYLWTIGTH